MPDPKKPELQFPLELPLKVFGKDEDDFESLVLDLLTRHVPQEKVTDLRRQISSGGKYLAVTVTFTAEDRAQMEAVYAELSRHERVLWVL
jgi:uncharacterized protein